MNENQDRDENVLEDCLFQLAVVDGVTSLKVEGTLGGVAEALANAAIQNVQLDEVLKMATYMLFEHYTATNKDTDEPENYVKAEANEIMEKLFGQMGKA
jgi:hypothetical protein